MASLALLVSLIFLFIIIIGPLTYLLSKCNFVPKFIIWIMAFLSIVSGIWWFVIIPVNILRFLGLLTAYLGYIATRSKEQGLDNR